MIKFRFHRGALKESMATIVEVKDIDDLLDHINETGNYGSTLTTKDLEFIHYGYDPRTGWDAYLVSGPTGVLGFINGLFD